VEGLFVCNAVDVAEAWGIQRGLCKGNWIENKYYFKRVSGLELA